MPTIVLWVYIVLLLAGGLVGFLKAGSRISLISSGAFAALLIPIALGLLRPAYLADVLMAVLLGFFCARFAKSKKFMPAGLMSILTVVALLLRRFQ
ncbi:MAG: TMEM14 family protein [Verrucomicrobia bacterium]|nr:TMEM14 family protein [Verrucomicrobiota bacterium]